MNESEGEMEVSSIIDKTTITVDMGSVELCSEVSYFYLKSESLGF